MNKLTQAIKLCLFTTSLTSLSYASAVQIEPQVTIADARAFIETTDIKQKEAVDTLNLAWYIKDRFSTLDTKNHWSNLLTKLDVMALNDSNSSIKYKDLDLNKDLSRRLNSIMSYSNYVSGHPYPQSPEKVALLQKHTKYLEKKYQANKVCDKKKTKDADQSCLNLKQASKKMASTLDEQELKQLWQKWHDSLSSQKTSFQQQVKLNNEGARRFGFANRAQMKLKQYELPVDDFIDELDQTWQEIEPLYKSLTCHVSNKLAEKYGDTIVNPNSAIPAHLLGSIAVKDLSSVYELVKPKDSVTDRGYNISEKLQAQPNLTVEEMLHNLEGYMGSLGFAPFKKSLYQFSQFTKPEHHQAACDSTAWWLPENEEARVGGCWNVDEDTFMRFNTTSLLTPTYFRAAHAKQPGHYSIWPSGLFVGTSRAFQYAYTPDYLKATGLLNEIPDESEDLGYLMKLALTNVASMPYKLAVNKWQKEVASGELTAKNYNKRWWQLREQYQGITAPTVRDKDQFDVGAIAEIIYNREQAGSFIGEVLGFQFYQSLCQAADNTNALSRCSFYGSKKVGAKLQAMFELGNSRPWREVMSALTDQTKLDGTAVINYFKPLQKYLDEQNKGQACDLELS